MTREESPVSGVTDSVYNEHGELEDETDDRGVTVHRDYDALDRLLAVSYPDPSLDVTYIYAAPGLFARGRLTGITRHGETIAYDYDRFGRMTRDGALSYTYDDNGNRTGIEYPDAVSVIYTYDHADRQKTLSLSVDGSPPVTLADNATYKPFGPLAGLSLGNGLTETRSYGQRYQPEGIRLDGTSTLFNWSYTVDLIGNITAIGDVLNPANNRTYGYQDNVYFLTQGNGPWGPRAWTYDRIGNRLTESRGAVLDSYVYQTNSAAGHNPNLQSITLGAGGSRSYGYDAVGNTIQVVDAEQQLDLVHDASRRLVEMISRPEDRFVALAYDGRSFLSAAGDDEAGCFPKQTFALYDSEGLLHRREHHLLDGASTVFLDSDTVLTFAGRPLAVLNLTPSTSKLTYLTTDHLGTPAAASSESGGMAWQGGFEPFGATWNVLDAAVFLRFPGQWSDVSWADLQEDYYNLFRWYLPNTGMFRSPDPIDQVQVAFTSRIVVQPGYAYAYALQRPLELTDALGLLAGDRARCVTRWTALGSVVGGGIGGVVGTVVGGTGSGGACTLFAPGLGTIGCGAAGGAAGAKTGATAGAFLGSLGGALFGNQVCDCEEPERPRSRPHEPDCREVKRICIAECTAATIPTGTLDGAPFFRCFRECMERYGC